MKWNRSRLYRNYDAAHAELFALVLKDGTPREVRLPISASSVAGYTAMSEIPFILKNLEFNELEAIHPTLRFDREYDKLVGFESVNLISIAHSSTAGLLGVLQLLNKQQGAFTREDDVRTA